MIKLNDNRKSLLIIFALGILVYLNSLWAGFFWDDEAIILRNPLIKSPAKILLILQQSLVQGLTVFYRPLQNLSYLFDFQFFKFNPAGYHFTNILLHCFLACLFYLLVLHFTRSRKVSLPSSILFLLSPLWVETVTYISGRADILMGIFLLLSFLFFLKERYMLAVAFYPLALLSKEASLIYPFVIFLYLFLFKRRGVKPIFSAAVISLMGVLFAILLFLRRGEGVLTAESSYGIKTRILFSITAFYKYVSLIFFPKDLHMSYMPNLPHSLLDVGVIFSFIFCAFLLVLFFYFLRRNQIVSFFLGWFVLFLIPQLNIIPINAFFADHFVYLSSMGIFVLFFIFLEKNVRRLIYYAVFLFYLVFFSFYTVSYNFVWQNPAKLFAYMIRLSPESYTVKNNLASLYLEKKNYKMAEPLLKEAIISNPGFSMARLNLARMYYLKGDLDRAVGLALNVTRENPKDFNAFNYLGTFYFKKGEYEKAEEAFRKATELNPGYVYVWRDLYSFYAYRGKTEEAQKIKKVIFDLDRYEYSRILYEDADDFLRNNNLEESKRRLDEAISINPRQADYFNLKGKILERKGEFLQAFYQYKKAISLSPDKWEAYCNLGNLLTITKELNLAESYLIKALGLSPDSFDVNFSLGRVYFMQKKNKEAKKFLEKAEKLNNSNPLVKEYLEKVSILENK